MSAKMSVNDIQKLMRQRGWSETKLAAELSLSEAAVRSWLRQGRKPNGAACVLMGIWLKEKK